MAKWFVGLSVPLRQVFLAATEAQLPASHPKIGEFNHTDPVDTEQATMSHALFQHIQELVYHRSDTEQNKAAFFPDSVTDLQKYAVVSHAPIKVTDITNSGSAAIGVPIGTDVELDIGITPVNAYNQELMVTSSDHKVATAWFTRQGKDGLAKLKIRGHDAGTAYVVIQSVDGYHTLKREVSVY